MTAPPRFASWLLDQFLVGERRESLIGDLTERYTARPSPLWFWRQATTAVVSSIFAQAVSHIWLVGSVLTLTVLLPKAYVRFVMERTTELQQTLPSGFLTWTIDRGVIWFYNYILVLLEFAPAVIFFCVTLGGLAFMLVRLRPQERGLILSVLILSCLVQSLGSVSTTVSLFLKKPTDPLRIFILFVQLTYVFFALPFSILKAGATPKRVNSNRTSP